MSKKDSNDFNGKLNHKICLIPSCFNTLKLNYHHILKSIIISDFDF